jgi:hypothetical protein
MWDVFLDLIRAIDALPCITVDSLFEVPSIYPLVDGRNFEGRVDVSHSRAYRHVFLSPNVPQRQPLHSSLVFIPVDLLLVGRGRSVLVLRLASEIHRHCGGRITCLADSVVDLFDGA